jgi:hypothetical protein
MYLFNRLWQQLLGEQAADAIRAATMRGLQLREPGFRPGLRVEGVLDGRAVSLEWRCGPIGARSRVMIDGRGRWRELITDEAGVIEALRGS